MGMFFSYTARIVAALAFLLGMSNIIYGFLITNSSLGQKAEALATYFPNYNSTGALIDRGFEIILFAIALGTIAEISFSLRNLGK